MWSDTVNERLVRWDLKVKWRKTVMGVPRKESVFSESEYEVDGGRSKV